RHGRRAPEGTGAWSEKYLQWVRTQVQFEYRAQQITLEDYLHQVQHAAARIVRLERSIDEAIGTLPAKTRGSSRRCRACAGSHRSVPYRSWPNSVSSPALSIRDNSWATREPSRASTPAARAYAAGQSARPATRTSDASWWRQPGPIGIVRPWARD